MRHIFLLTLFFLTGSVRAWGSQTFPVSIYVDEEFRSNPYWSQDLHRVLENVNIRYHRLFNIEFTWQEPVYWESANTNTSIYQLLDQLTKDTAARPPGMVLCLTGQKNLQGNELGVARYLNGQIIVKRSDYFEDTIVHEIAHVFGSVHVEREPLLMNAVVTGAKNLPFDAWNKEIIALHRERQFLAVGYPIGKKHLARIADIYRELISFDRSDHALYINLGLVYSELDMHEKAIRTLHEVETYYYLRSTDYQDNHEKNLYHLQQAREYLGMSLVRGKKWDDAVYMLESLFSDDPESISLQWNLAVAYANTDYFSQAQELFENVARQLPDSVPVQLNLGYVYVRQGIDSLAEEKFRWVITQDPADPSPYQQLGSLYYRQGKHRDAIQLFDKALRLNENNAAVYEMRGMVFHTEEKYDRALEDYSRALSLDRDLKTARYNRGIIYVRQGKQEKAKKEFTYVIDRFPDDALGYAGLGAVSLKQGETKRSRVLLEKARKRDSSLAEVHANLYRVYRLLGLEKKAKKAAKRYRKLTGKDPP